MNLLARLDRWIAGDGCSLSEKVFFVVAYLAAVVVLVAACCWMVAR